MGWRLLEIDDADMVRSQIMDLCLSRSWQIHAEAPPDVPEEFRYFLRRLNELETKINRLAKKQETGSSTPLRVRAITLSPETGGIPLFPTEPRPAVDDFVEIRLTLPAEEEILILGQVTSVVSGEETSFQVRFVTVAQDQADHIVRYLLNRQRLEQTQKKFY